MSISFEKENNQKRAIEILRRLQPLYENSPCPLNYENPLQLLLAVIMAAQCTDDRVNQVTAVLFMRFSDVTAIANANLNELETILQPLSFYRNKAKYIQNTCQILIDRFNGQVPPNIKDLVKLPGVARKTATMVLHYAYKIDAGITVDTHVKRLSDRLDLSKQSDLEKIEKDLMAILPESEWGNCFVNLTYHGRMVCTAKKPDCLNCVIADLCPSAM